MLVVQLEQRTGPGQRVVAGAVLDRARQFAPLVSRREYRFFHFLLPEDPRTGALVRPRPILDFLGIHRLRRSFQFMSEYVRVRRY